jgi:ribosomal RNA-processing protein 17
MFPNLQVQYEQPKVEVKTEDDTEVLPGMELKSKKDIQKIIKKQATKTVQKSRAFQTKGKIEQRKQRKKSSKLKSQRITMRAKSGKGSTKQTKGNKSGRGKARH